MSAAGQETKAFNNEQANLYAKLIIEESYEFVGASCVNTAFDDQDDYYLPVVRNENTIKEACDVIVVAAGYLISMLGVDGAQRAWDCVHANNVAKVVGKIEKRADGKIMKGDTGKAERKAQMMGELLELLNDNR
jgi:predicted HAD superfamily Cof-like phosphohydrolase